MPQPHPAVRGVRPAVMEIKSVSNDGVFDGYLSRFNDEDAYGDIVMPGAFTKTLKPAPVGKGTKRPLLWQHAAFEPVGVLEARQDDQGLFITGTLNQEVQRAREALSLIKQGAVTGLSQGFQTIIGEARKDNPMGRLLREVDLWEGSLATFPALTSAQIISARAALPPWLQEDAAQGAIEARMQGLARISRALRA